MGLYSSDVSVLCGCPSLFLQTPSSHSEMRDSMKSKRANRAEGDGLEEEEEQEEGKEPAVATTAADSSALAMV